MAAAREAWRVAQPKLDPARLIFVDETGASTKMARPYGRARCGEHCISDVPHGHWKTTTFVGGLRLSGMTAPMVFDGAMNGPAFVALIGQGRPRSHVSIQHLLRQWVNDANRLS